MSDAVWQDKLISADRAFGKVHEQNLTLDVGTMIAGAIDPANPDEPPRPVAVLQIICAREKENECCSRPILNIIPGVAVFTMDDLVARVLMHNVNYHQEVLHDDPVG